MFMSNLIIGILLALLGIGVLGGLLLAAFSLGTRQREATPKKDSPPSSAAPQKRRVPTAGSTIPTGGIAQTQFHVTSVPGDSSPKDTA